jgi:hypothetical protein
MIFSPGKTIFPRMKRAVYPLLIREEGLGQRDTKGDCPCLETEGKGTHQEVYIIPEGEKLENTLSHWNKINFPFRAAAPTLYLPDPEREVRK